MLNYLTAQSVKCCRPARLSKETLLMKPALNQHMKPALSSSFVLLLFLRFSISSPGKMSKGPSLLLLLLSFAGVEEGGGFTYISQSPNELRDTLLTPESGTIRYISSDHSPYILIFNKPKIQYFPMLHNSNQAKILKPLLNLLLRLMEP